MSIYKSVCTYIKVCVGVPLSGIKRSAEGACPTAHMPSTFARDVPHHHPLCHDVSGEYPVQKPRKTLWGAGTPFTTAPFSTLHDIPGRLCSQTTPHGRPSDGRCNIGKRYAHKFAAFEIPRQRLSLLQTPRMYPGGQPRTESSPAATRLEDPRTPVPATECIGVVSAAPDLPKVPVNPCTCACAQRGRHSLARGAVAVGRRLRLVAVVLQTVADQLSDGDAAQAVARGKLQQLRRARHGAVLRIHNLAQRACARTATLPVNMGDQLCSWSCAPQKRTSPIQELRDAETCKKGKHRSSILEEG
jgi:hypothetical protein